MGPGADSYVDDVHDNAALVINEEFTGTGHTINDNSSRLGGIERKTHRPGKVVPGAKRDKADRAHG